MADRVERAVGGYLANLLFFTGAILLYRNHFYYQDFLLEQTQDVLLWAYVAYLVAGLPFALLAGAGSESKGFIALRAVLRYASQAWNALSLYPLNRDAFPAMSKEGKRALLFFLVKFFFLPIMLNFFFQNWQALAQSWGNLEGGTGWYDLLFVRWYAVLIPLLFLIDTAYFTFGYSVEHRGLKNEVRSVEPTLLGWLVAIICYPPFNDMPGVYVGWAANDYAAFDSLPLTAVLRIAVLLCLLVYVWATLALGAKCSNLTNRGIVSRGPYGFVRHPAYVAKNLGWWLTSIPFILSTGRVWFAVFSMGAWSLIYFLRAVTEERHLINDPEYREYCTKVRWRFIPYVI